MSGFSINTNLATATALNNLTTSGTVLNGTQQQVSTGLRVGGATSDASDFAIAQGIRGDLKGRLAVANAQAQAHGLLGVTNAAVTSISDTLSQMKATVVQATSGANTASQLQALQDQYDALAKQIDEMARGATYNGTNLLTPPTTGPNIDPVVIFNLQGSGATLQTGDALTVTFSGDLDFSKLVNSDPYAATVTLTRTDTLSGGGTATATVGTQTIPAQVVTIGAGSTPTLTFNDTIPAGVTASSYQMTITQTNGVGTAFANTTTQTLTQAYTVGSAFNVPASSLDNNQFTPPASSEKLPPVSFLNSTDGSSLLSVSYNDVSASTLGVSGQNLKTGATSALTAVATAMTTIGALSGYYGQQTQAVDANSTFYQSITDSVTTGLGALVDANLPEQAAKMQAEQVRQQLSAQMMPIANSQFQIISRLYQNG